MQTNSDDPSFVVQLLEDFRSGGTSQRRVSNIISRLQCSDNEAGDSLKRKLTLEDKVTNDAKFPKLEKSTPGDLAERSSRCTSPPASPWENHRVRSQLVDANIKISDLENQISRHHSVRQQMELLFMKEKDSLQKQVDQEKSMKKELENHLQSVRKREVDAKEELKQCRITVNREKNNFEECRMNLQRDNARLTDLLEELEQTIQSERMTSTSHIQLLTEQISEKDKQLVDIKERNSELEQQLQEILVIQTQAEELNQELLQTRMKLKELEKEREDQLEAGRIVKSQQEKVLHYPILEKEMAALKEENCNLKKAVPKHLLLEEMVQDLQTRQAVSEEQAHELTWSQGRLNHLQTVLGEWNKVAKDYCDGYMSSSHPPDPAVIRSIINELQQRVHLLTVNVADYKSQYNEARQKKEMLTIELQTSKKEIENIQKTSEQQNIKMKLLQKKLKLVSMERDSYRMQLDSYEKDLTISSLPNQQCQQLQQRLETMERLSDGYRRMVEKLESDSGKMKASGGNADIMDKLYRLESDRIVLLQEKEQLQKRKDELEVQLEYRAIKGDFNLVSSKVVHYRMNPTVEAEAQYKDDEAKLKLKCSRLEERIKLLEEGNVHDITQKVDEKVTSSNIQEIEGLQEIINAQEIKMQRLKELFHASAKEFREVCYGLFGYKIDRNENIYTLSNMYADSPDDHLMFKQVPDGTIDMMETPFSATLEELIDLHLHNHKSLPLFLGAVTVDLFNRQTLSQTISETIELN